MDYASGRSCELLPGALSTLPLHAPMRTASGTPRHSDYNNTPSDIQPTPKSTARELVITSSQNWYRFIPLLTAQIPDAVMAAVTRGKQVGMQGIRPIFEVEFGGKTQRIAVTVGNNGFIVGANPAP